MALNQGPAQIYYRDFFADATNDPFNGNYANALAPYNVPAVNTMPAADVRTLAVNCRSQNVPTAFPLQHNDGKQLYIYIQLDKFHPRFGLPATPYDNRIYIAKGELHHNHH